MSPPRFTKERLCFFCYAESKSLRKTFFHICKRILAHPLCLRNRNKPTFRRKACQLQPPHGMAIRLFARFRKAEVLI